MPRQNRRRADHGRSGGGAPAAQRIDDWRGERYVVRQLGGSAGPKAYRCPGCDQEIGAGRPHLVAWPEFDGEASDRRHWHTPCWAARESRAPGIQRTRSAPRY